MGKATKRKAAQRQKKEAVYTRSLKQHSKHPPLGEKRLKRQDIVSAITRILGPGIIYDLLDGKKLQDWKPRGKTNHTRQLNFMRWALSYPVPKFLVWSVINRRARVTHLRRNRKGHSLHWAHIVEQVGRGASLYKLAGGAFSRKEAHYFLSGPYDTIAANIWFAKLKAAKVNDSMIFTFVAHIADREGMLCRDCWDEFIPFIARYNISSNELKDLMDFVMRGWDHIRTLRKRTLASLRVMMEEWHRFEIADEDAQQSWDGMGIEDWIFHGVSGTWKISEILTAKDLSWEARIQRHCVGHYLQDCVSGFRHIFTMTLNGSDQGRVTIEVSQRNIIQARGKMNLPLSPRARSVIRRWAARYNIGILPRISW